MKTEDTIEVVGAGLGRTGTASLKKALEILGYDPTYHMFENLKQKHNVFWIQAFDGEEVDFNDVFCVGETRYKATCDWPSSVFWEEQLRQYPQAKVILTKRNSEKWYQSCVETIFAMNPSSPFSALGTKIHSWLGLRAYRMADLQYRMMQRTFQNIFAKDHMIHCFEKYNEDVIARCPPEKLLVFEVSQGWEPLCKFLQQPIPDVPFPHVNDTDDFKKMIIRANRIGYAILSIVCFVLPATVAAVYYGRNDQRFSSISSVLSVKGLLKSSND